LRLAKSGDWGRNWDKNWFGALSLYTHSIHSQKTTICTNGQGRFEGKKQIFLSLKKR
jgi:hypothetical protein